jgi:hypothetical protein
MSERWLALSWRFFSACRARLVACAEFAKGTAPVISPYERRRTMRISVSIVNTAKPVRILLSAGKLLF